MSNLNNGGLTRVLNYIKTWVNGLLSDKLAINTGRGLIERSGNGQYLYCQIATITIIGAYVNSPIVLEISGRGILFSTVQILFENTSSTDPNISKFVSDSYEYFYIKKIDTSTWAVYVKYTQIWGTVTVHRASGKGLALTNVSCNFTASDLSELPSECTQVSSNLATVATSGSYNDLSNKPTSMTPTTHTHTKSQITDFPTIPSKTSQLTNDSGYLTSHQSLSSRVAIAGDTMTGTLNLKTENNVCLNLRPSNSDYYDTISVQTAGNEAVVFATKNSVTSWMFINGEDSVTNHADSRWQSLTPGLQIKSNKVAIGKLIANGSNLTYPLEVNGTISASNVKVTNNSSNGVLFGSYRVYVG